MSDVALCKDVVDELEFEPRVNASRIGVSVEDGKVTLSGQVTSYAEKLAALAVVSSVKGVEAVAERISVRPGKVQRLADVELARRIDCVLAWISGLREEAVSIVVENGHVTLMGSLEWRYQAEVLELMIGQLNGVTGLTDSLEIGCRASRSDILRRIRSAFHRDAELNAAAIEIEAADGKVTLVGLVRNQAEKRAAERAAWAAPGVRQVINRLDVG